jgi:hypothetical protein
MAEITINSIVLDEIERISSSKAIDVEVLKDFAIFVIQNHKKKTTKKQAQVPRSAPKSPAQKAKVKPLKYAELKEAIYQYFEVGNTAQLKKSNDFKMATSLWEDLNLSQRESWERIYRKYIGILPEEVGEEGEGCINGINIFKYFRPYQVFGLDPQSADKADIKQAYYQLSKIYHPDNRETGNAKIFDRINTMYQSIAEEFK